MAGDRYIPQHPLPTEIQGMDRDDTVCQFCGVSYLIHNEMKALMKRVEEAEKTMEHYKGSVEREEELKVKVKNMEGDKEKLCKTLQAIEERSKLFLTEINFKDEQINKLNKDNKQSLQKILEAEQKNTKLTQQLSNFKESLSDVLKHTQRYRTDLKSLKTTYNNHLKGIDDYCQGMIAFIDEMCKKLTQEADKLQQQLIKTNSEKEALEMKCKQLQTEIHSIKEEISTLKETSQMSSDVQAKCDRLQKETESNKEDIKILQDKIKQHLSDVLSHQETARLKSEEIDKLKQDLQVLKDSSTKDKHKLQEVILNKEKEVYNVMKQNEQLQKTLDELNITEHENKEMASSSQQQIKTLKDSLSQAKTELSILLEEKEKMITAHHNRIEQLRESFKFKMNEADAWPAKFAKAIEELEKKHKEEQDEMWKELNNSFQKDMEQEEQRHAEELNLWKTEAKNTQDKFKQGLSAMTRKHREELQQLRVEAENTKKEASKTKESSSTIISNLEAKINDLQSRQNQRSTMSADQMTSLQAHVQQLQQLNDQAEREMITLEREFMSSKEQVEVLQDTVRRECEERLELTDALTEARTQLLSLQRLNKVSSSQTSLTSVNSSNSSPSRNPRNGSTVCQVGFDGINAKSSSRETGRDSRSGSVDESRQRINNALGRNGSRSRLGDSR